MNETITAQDQQATKVCPRCKRELPVSEFYRNKSQSDGLNTYCKECFNKYYLKNRASAVTPPKVGNPELSGFTPRQLIQELRDRGYRGTLTYTNEIKL